MRRDTKESGRADGTLTAVLAAAVGIPICVVVLLRGLTWYAIPVFGAGMLLSYGVGHELLRKAWGRPVGAACGALVCLLGIGNILWHPPRPEVREAERAASVWSRAKGRVLGEYLAKTYAGSTALVVRCGGDRRAQEAISAMKDAAGGAIRFSGEETVSALSPTSGYADDFTQERLERIVAANRGCALLVSFAGIPRDVDEHRKGERIWDWPKDRLPTLVLTEPVAQVPKAAVRTGAVGAIVVGKRTGSEDWTAPPPDLRAAFDRAFFLITPDNCDRLDSRYDWVFEE